MKTTMKEQRKRIEREKQKTIFNSKKEFGKGLFIYDARTKV